MRSLLRRTEQMMLESVGAVEKPKDEYFNNIWKRLKKSDKLLKQVDVEVTKYLAALKEVARSSRAISDLLVQFVEGENEDPRNSAVSRGNGYNAIDAGREDVEYMKQKDFVVEKARKVADVTRSIDDRILPMCDETLQTSFRTISKNRCEQFPTYTPCVDKRISYMRDMDAYERKLESAQNAKKKDMELIDSAKQKTERSKNRFQNFSSRLVDDLLLFDANRGDVGNELIDSFTDSMLLTVNREQSIVSLLGN